MEPSESTHPADTIVAMTIADYVNIDANGKANLVGAGIRVLSHESGTSASSPFAVWVTLSLADVPAHPVIVELVLTAPDGTSVRLDDASGRPSEVRITQSATFATMTPIDLPDGHLPPMHVLAANFPNGLHFPPGRLYRWQVEADGVIAGTYPFYVAGAE
ncbi:hypothetical protein ASE16_00840 [Leifsonia sp. Root227]|jgi:hypothetical protein|uniref:hypothetical protein n=1 Tax=unclassified Leifsonia TaxID=2663824 RepID=UPI0006F6AE4A|nr:hypothetical protein [Leifsonia sp. Root227]KRC51673.1 hypothetical protein ASE16_00840 [Leifsonia sp. Root227]